MAEVFIGILVEPIHIFREILTCGDEFSGDCQLATIPDLIGVNA